jgi:hypothetical protein
VESAQNGIGFWGLADLQVRGMSALGQKQTFRCFAAMSALCQERTWPQLHEPEGRRRGQRT